MDKFCIHCKHHNERQSGTHECLHPDWQKPVDLVTGGKQHNWCDTMRLNACGKEGTLWEAK